MLAKILLALAGVAVLLAIAGGTSSNSSDHDARVEIVLPAGTAVDPVRQQVTELARSAWAGRQVGETSDSEDATTVVIALPGASLDPALSWLRNERNTGARSSTVNMDVDPAQVGDPGLASSEPGVEPEPVILAVDISSESAGGPWVIVAIALLVAIAALVALWLVQRSAVEEDYDEV